MVDGDIIGLIIYDPSLLVQQIIASIDQAPIGHVILTFVYFIFKLFW